LLKSFGSKENGALI